MKVQDLMTTNVLYAKPNTSLEEVANYMKKQNVGSIPVCEENGQVLGIITDRDIVLKAVSQGRNDMKAQDIMNTNLISATPDMNAHEAANLMAKNQIRRLPVIVNNQLTGILSMADIARKNIYVDEAGNALSAISKPSNLN